MSEKVTFKYPKVVHAAKSEYIDPTDCGSMVSYRITSEGYFDASVDLSDCGRKITWSFEPEDVEKIDLAISMLSDFRKELIKAGKRWNKIEEEAKKFRAAQRA